MSKKEFERTFEEMKNRMNMNSNEKECNKGLWIGLGIAVVAILVAVVIWLRKKDEEIEEYYEYFDDEVEDELGEDIYAEDDNVEYVQLNSNDSTEPEELDALDEAEDETPNMDTEEQ